MLIYGSVGVGIGLPLGVGGEVNYRISDHFSVSTGFYAGSFSRSFDGDSYSGQPYETTSVIPGTPGSTTTSALDMYGEPALTLAEHKAYLNEVHATNQDGTPAASNPDAVLQAEVDRINAGNGVTTSTTPGTPDQTVTTQHAGKQYTAKYDVDLKLRAIPITFNYHPFAGAFRLSAGVIVNNTKATGTQSGDNTAEGSFDLGGKSFAMSELGGSVTYSARFKNTVMPYVGIGGTGNFGKSNWGYFWDLGAMYTGGIKASVRTGAASVSPELAAALAAEEADFKDSIPQIKVLPVAKFGFSYSF